MDEQYIPIDIHTNKLSDWLVSRRHCNRDWPSRILTIREKINNAIQDMPVHEGIAKLLSGSYINYFHCLKIVEILKETEANSKNFFGSYGSKRMKDWQEVIRLYEKDNVYLAEAAQMLIRNVAYEVPLLKKQIAKLEQSQQDCDKKDAEYGKAAAAARSEFQMLCKQLGIQGQSIKRELVELLKELPDIYSKIARNTHSLQQPVEFYTEFVKFIFGKEHPGGCVPLLKYMIDKGDTTVYEWRYGEPPLKIEEPPLSFTFEDEETNANTDTIDFGEDAEAGIDFGVLNQQDSITLETGDIDWGISTNEESSENNNLEELDLNISLEDCGITVESSGVEGGVAKNVEALTVLDNPATRNQFIDELLEVEAFLKVRLSEMQGPSNILSLSQLQDAKPLLQLQTIESVTAMLDQVQVVIKEVTASRSQHLYNIKHSPRYVDHLASKLKQKLGVADKMVASQQAVRMRKKDMSAEIHDLQPKLKLIIAKTKELQAEIEADISKRYKNRPVNLMGGVNVL